MGGLVKGDQAAVIAASTFVSRVLRMAKMPEPERLSAAAVAANEAVYRALNGKGGATLSAVMVGQRDQWLGVNVGDSRIYGITATRAVVQLSRDDTLAGYLEKDNRFNDHRNQLVQYIGMGEGLEPHIVSPKANEFETVLITSDGVHSAPADAFAQSVMHAKTNLDLVRNLNRLSDILGGRDNATTLAFPTRLVGLDGDYDQGLNLTFLSASSSFEIWLPILLEGNRVEQVPQALNDVSDIASSNQDRPASKRETRQHAGQRRGQKKKKGSSNDPALPLENKERPAVEVQFPKKPGAS
jgi:serine/threonine protein phosphatase PrpC